jgi:hypothetical protein
MDIKDLQKYSKVVNDALKPATIATRRELDKEAFDFASQHFHKLHDKVHDFITKHEGDMFKVDGAESYFKAKLKKELEHLISRL